MLAATRNDDELRKKEAELILIKERAERDKQEREALQSLKMTLEAEKKKVEDSLEAERALALDKDALLDRSKKREGELEEEVAALQADLDVLDSQLDRAMKIQKESEDKHESLRIAFDQAAEHLVRLENEQNEWITRETELNELLEGAHVDIEELQGNLEELQKVSEELKNLALQREEDLARAKDRMDVAVKELEGKLSVETLSKYVSTKCLLLKTRINIVIIGTLLRRRATLSRMTPARRKRSSLKLHALRTTMAI